MIDFVSDNASGLCPEALDAIVAASGGRAGAYGADDDTARAMSAFAEVFGRETTVFFVATGTAANTLAIASLTRPWQQILCEEFAHLANDESTAPERLTGCRVVTLPAGGRKLTPDDVDRRAGLPAREVHHPAPGVVSISNPTEFGEVYGPAEVAALADAAHRHGYRLHVDGARFANAVAALDCDPRELSVDAGVDALSLGGTKNGLALGEAVLLFPGPAQADAADAFPTLRKSSGHLLSKHRYVTAPFQAVLADGAWLRHAAHANEMARRLSAGLADLGCPPRFATQANGVFATLDADVDERLRAAGWVFHLFGPPGGQAARFMTSFDTPPERVDALLVDAAETRRE
jgi:threonine aldolase